MSIILKQKVCFFVKTFLNFADSKLQKPDHMQNIKEML